MVDPASPGGSSSNNSSKPRAIIQLENPPVAERVKTPPGSPTTITPIVVLESEDEIRLAKLGCEYT